MDVKLKPCPFCGGSARPIKTIIDQPNFYNEYHQIMCNDCKAMTMRHKSEEIAKEAWNRRVEE